MAILLVAMAGLYYLGSQNQRVKAATSAPQLVWVGEPFTITITLKNQTNTAQELVSISLDKAILDDGLHINATMPAYRTSEREGAWTSFIFARRRRPMLPPNGEDIVRLTLIAQTSGRYDTDVVLWFNNQLQGVFVSVNVEAVPHPTPWLGR